MRLVKQSHLHFKEGNSDKIYIIDLCETGNEKYVVTFRYGRRDTQLREGTKTPVPVELSKAELIYDELETEKLNKGYAAGAAGTTSRLAKKVFTLEGDKIIPDTKWQSQDTSRKKSVLQRLEAAVNGTADKNAFKWTLSRVIWKAGEYKFVEAVPYIIKLFGSGDQLHQTFLIKFIHMMLSMDSKSINPL